MPVATMKPYDDRWWRQVLAASAVWMASAAILPVTSAHAEGWYARTIRPAGFWSGADATAHLFGQLPRDTVVEILEASPAVGATRFLARELDESNLGYIEAIVLDPSDPPPGERAPSAFAFRPLWIATLKDVSLVSASGESVATLPQFAKALALTPPDGGRYYVQDARTGRVGWVDGSVVGPGSAPTPEDEVIWASPAFATISEAYRPWWVAAHRPTELWSATEGGTSFGAVKVGDQFLVMEPQKGARLSVFNPVTRNFAFVDASSVGPSSGPKPPAVEVGGWVGIVTGDKANLRREPHTVMAAAGQVQKGDEVTVSAWVEGEELESDNRTWARVMSVRRQASNGQWVELPLGDIAPERYVYSGLIRPVQVTEAPVAPDLSLGAGGAKWIDVNISAQSIVAYEGKTPVYVAPITSGRPGWSTPLGVFRIQRRVENETMLGSTLLRLDTREVPNYRLENVKWTQYFTGDGAAIHTNYWRSPALFGIPSSHGCLGMIEKHARWFWDWAGVGTALNIHP
jgi:lipoprotein-anchoring transpeptidase ErfK/SrfK